MENNVQVRACFTGCNIKSGKTVMQFELDPEYKGALPQLAMMTGTFVTLELTSDQMVLSIDMNSGEVLEVQESAFDDELEEDPIDMNSEDQEVEFLPLPPATDYDYEGDENEAA